MKLSLREKHSSLVVVVYLDPYKFLNGLAAYWAFVRLKPQLFGTFAAHTLKKKKQKQKQKQNRECDKCENKGLKGKLIRSLKQIC